MCHWGLFLVHYNVVEFDNLRIEGLTHEQVSRNFLGLLKHLSNVEKNWNGKHDAMFLFCRHYYFQFVIILVYKYLIQVSLLNQVSYYI